MALPDDHAETTAAWGIYADDGVIVGTVRVALAAPPAGLSSDPSERCWQLKGMAVREDLRDQGLGTRLLDAVIAHVGANGGGLLWCNARLAARTLYQRRGLVEHGEAWNDPEIGPHVVMWQRFD